MKKQRIVIVEPSEIVCIGLANILQGSEFEVIAQLSSVEDLESCHLLSSADIIVVGSQTVAAGVNMRYQYEALQSRTFVIMISTVREDEFLRQADGVINIYDSKAKLIKKLQSAVEQSQTNPYSDSHELSERERDVLILVAKGMANKEIADELNISIHTVMSHRKNIAHKTGIKSVAGLTVYALLNNMLEASEVNI
jgi:DNA-binding NarL/FixJ family response regulator